MYFSSITSHFLDNACTKIINMAFKTSKIDQMALEYWYNSFLGHLRVDGRGFFHQKPILKKGSARPEIKMPHMRIGCKSPFKTLIACSQTPYFFLKVLRARVVNINRGRFIDRQRKGAGVGEEEKDFAFKWLSRAHSFSLSLCMCIFVASPKRWNWFLNQQI